MTDRRRRDLTIIAGTLAAIALVALAVIVLAGGDADSQAPPAATSTSAAPPQDARAAARASIERNAIRYQRALGPNSSDDPCRYMTPEAADEAMFHADPALRAGGCRTVVRTTEKRESRPLYELLDEGVTDIEFSPRVPVAGIAGTAAGAQATWRGDSSRTATFVERDGQWLIAK